jgi:hypothetical protein
LRGSFNRRRCAGVSVVAKRAISAISRRQLRRAQERLGVGGQRVKPQLLGPLVGDVEIGAVALVTGAETDRLPVAGLVTGAGVGLRIGETLGQQRAVAEVLPPLLGQRPHGGGQALAGEIGGTAFGREQQEAAVLDEELEPLEALVGAPGKPAVAILERVTRRPQTRRATGWPARSTSWRK